MLMRPVRRAGRGGLLGVAARTAVVAGTATAVSGGVRRHQQNKAYEAAEAQAYEQQQAAMAYQPAYQPAAPPPAYQPAAPPPAPAQNDVIARLSELGQLKAQGVLTDAEFAAAKAKILG